MDIEAMARSTVRVLIIEESDADAERVLRELRRSSYEVISERVSTAEALEKALKTNSWDIVLAGAAVRQLNAREAIAILRQNGIDIPLVVVSTQAPQDGSIDAIKYGARDYVSRQQLSRLVAIVERTLNDASLRQQPEEILLHQAYHDALTGLPNRMLFEYRLHQALKRAQSSGTSVAVIAF